MFVEKGKDHLKAVVLHQTILSGAQAKLPASQGIKCIVQHAGVVHKAIASVKVQNLIDVGLHEATVPDLELLEVAQVVIDSLPFHKHLLPFLFPNLQLQGLVLLPLLAQLDADIASLLDVEVLDANKLVDVYRLEDALGTEQILIRTADVNDWVLVFLA